MDQEGKESRQVRAARDERVDYFSMLGHWPMTVVEIGNNTKLISFWTHNESMGYRLHHQEIPSTDYRFSLLRPTHAMPPRPAKKMSKFWGPDGPPPLNPKSIAYQHNFMVGPAPETTSAVRPDIGVPFSTIQFTKSAASGLESSVASSVSHRHLPSAVKQSRTDGVFEILGLHATRAVNVTKPAERTAYRVSRYGDDVLNTASTTTISRKDDHVTPATLFDLVQSSSEDSTTGIYQHAAVLQMELDTLNYKIAELDLERKQTIKDYQRLGKFGKNLRNRRKDLERRRDEVIRTGVE
ncbi:hypothetical protein E8E12_004266 [Didymella heteroderae]|uniref:Uncharacterized protein n=1 Tax=Didymella heteroderae TaxID=1769908 RepID=A0A9P5BY42_9PLEO|nr:hypothetical protein E8E12_004266 [Didymella heteroderae]